MAASARFMAGPGGSLLLGLGLGLSVGCTAGTMRAEPRAHAALGREGDFVDAREGKPRIVNEEFRDPTLDAEPVDLSHSWDEVCALFPGGRMSPARSSRYRDRASSVHAS